MSKMMKTIGKLKLWTLLGVVLIVAGIVIAAVFGFNADTTASDYKTLSVKLDSYETGARVERIDEICTGEIDKAGLTVLYSQKNEFSNSSCEMLYVFSEDVTTEKLDALKNAVSAVLETESEPGVLYNTFVYATAGDEVVSSVLPEGYLWRAALAAAVALVLEFVYVSVRYKLNMGVTATVSSLMAVLLTVALTALVRIPVTTSVAYAAAFAMLYSMATGLVIFSRMRSAFKSDEYKEKSAEEAIASSVPAKGILFFAAACAVALVLVGAIATAAVRWFAVTAFLGLLAATFSSLLFLPAMYLPLKKSADKKAALRARYDYKKESAKDKRRAGKGEPAAKEGEKAPETAAVADGAESDKA